MKTNRVSQIHRAMAILLSVVAITVLSVSMIGTLCEADCDVDCQEESGAGCDCICCPNNIVMSQSDYISNQLEFVIHQWTPFRPDLLSEQEWFTNIDYPPRDLS